MIEQIRSLVRPVVTLAMVAALIWFTYLDKIPVDALVPLAVMVVAFWFKDKAAAKPNGDGS